MLHHTFRGILVEHQMIQVCARAQAIENHHKRMHMLPRRSLMMVRWLKHLIPCMLFSRLYMKVGQQLWQKYMEQVTCQAQGSL
jgi:hypothetical protein